MYEEVDRTTPISRSRYRDLKNYVPPSTFIIEAKGMFRPWLASIVAPNNSRIYIEDNVKEADFVLSSVLGFEPCTFDPCVYPNTPLLLGMNVTLNN